MSEDVENITVTPDIGSSDQEFGKNSSSGEDSDNEEKSNTNLSPFETVVVKNNFRGKHDLNSLKEKVYSCDACNVFFTLEIYYLRHIKLKHGVLVDLTQVSDQQTEDPSNIRCNTCGKKFPSNNALKLHILRIHQGVNCFKCKICNAYFQQYTVFMNHMKYHNNDENYTCEECNYKTNNKELMGLHKMKHNKEFSCRVCCKIFTKLDKLTAHEKTHKDLKSFYCEVCHRGFVRPSDLTIHRKIHSNEKQFQCEVCLTRFRHRSALIVHMRQHTGERPYVCPNCNKGYAQSGNLKMHLLKCKPVDIPAGV